MSYERSGSAIVGYGIVTDGEEAEEYTSFGGYELYKGDYTDLDTFKDGVAIVNVGTASAYKSVALMDEYTENQNGTELPPADKMWTLKKAGEWLANGYRFTTTGDISLCMNNSQPGKFLVTSDIWLKNNQENPNKPNMILVPQGGDDKVFKIRVSAIDNAAYNYIGFANNQFMPTSEENAATFSLYDVSGNVVAVDTANAESATSANDKQAYYIASNGRVLTHDLTADGKLESTALRWDKTTKIVSKEFNPKIGSESALIWSFDLFTQTATNALPQDFRIKTKAGSRYFPIQFHSVNNVVEGLVNATSGSKFFFSKHDNYVLIDSLDVTYNTRTGYYLYLDTDGKFKYKQYPNEADAVADTRTHFQLYVPISTNIESKDYAHKYEVGTILVPYEKRNPNDIELPKGANVPGSANTSNAKVLKLYATPGEKLLIQVGSGSFNMIKAGDNFHADVPNPGIADVNYVTSNNNYSWYEIVANAEGNTVITLWQDDVGEWREGQHYENVGRNIIRIEVQVGGNIEDTFRGPSNPYRHLDVEVKANFSIYVYNENYNPNDGSEEYHVITPEKDSINVVGVYTKVYNTAALASGEKRAVWNGAYMSSPGTSGSRPGAVNTYTNPYEFKRVKDGGIWIYLDGRVAPESAVSSSSPYIDPNSITYDKDGNPQHHYIIQTDPRYTDFQFGMEPPAGENGETTGNIKPGFEYKAADKYNGETVQSVVLTYNNAEVQENHQLEFLQYGWGWTQFYDGDTAELHCTIQYKYDNKIYKADYVVTRLICDTNNVCPSAFDYSWPQHGFDIDVIIDDIIEVESNELVKVDQYGNGIPGAEFDFYPTGPDYKVAENATPVAALHAVTDENGRFQFTKTQLNSSGNEQTTIMSLRDIKKALNNSDHFVMRETKAPVGYRSIPQDAHLYFEGSADSKELFVRSANAFESGVIANGDANVIAPQRLYKPGSSPGFVGAEVPYYSIDSQTGDFTFYGDLYAVVLKRNGANPDATSVSGLNLAEWSPVYGDDMEGYTVEKPENGQIAANIVKRLISENKGVYKFEPNITGRFCSASVSQLPGNLTRYYTYKYNTNKLKDPNDPSYLTELKDLEYIVSYYFVPYFEGTQRPNLDGITRINSHDVDTTDDEFKIHWATTIEAPNFTNNLYFQKVNSEGALLNDAYFALYNAAEITPTGSNTPITCIESYGSYYDLKSPTISNQEVYKGKADIYDAAGNIRQRNCDYSINCNPYDVNGKHEVNGMVEKPYIGQITVTDGGGNRHYISPVHRTDDASKSFVGYTHTAHETEGGDPLNCITASAEGGTGHFVRLPQGNYILMEIKPPSGYEINPTKVKVAVTDKGVFANAGTFDDGVIVAKGVGYLAKTMTSFASKGNINESLTWIAAHLNVNESNLYSALEDKTDANWKFAPPGNEYYKGKTSRAHRAFYRGEDYVYPGSSSDISREKAMVTYLLYDPKSQNYVDQTGAVTTNRKLFQYAVNFGELPPDKGVTPTDEHYKAGQFAREKKTVQLNSKNINIRPTAEGTGTLRLYTDIGWSFLSVFQDSGYALQDGIRNPTSLYNDLTTENERLQYLFSNATYVQLTDPISIGLTVVKEGKDPNYPDDPNKNKQLEGAEFRIYKTVEGKQYFYKLKDGVKQEDVKDSSDVEWTGDESKATKLTSVLTPLNNSTDQKALFRVHGLAEGTYYLEEIKAPDGYTCATPQKISIKVENGRFVLKFNDKEPPVPVLASSDPLYDDSHGDVQIQQYAVTVVDVNDLQINIRKVSSDVPDTLLAGAKFILYKKETVNGAERIQYYESYNDGTVVWTETESEALELTSTSTEPMKISGLTEGTYYLKEKEAPPGYYALTSDIEITVTETGNLTVSAKYESGDAVTCEKVESASNGVVIYEITVPNTTGYALPETGGIGTQIYTFSGIILMLAAAVLLVIKKPLVTECVRRRRERRPKR